jgi:hypothetical protein
MLVGFIIGGLGLVLGPSWPLFWVGVAIVAVGGVLALAVGIFSDVVTYMPVDITYEPQRASAAAEGTTGAHGVETRAMKTESPAAASGDGPRTDAENLASG